MKKIRFYNFYEDARHGWLAVKRKELIELGIIDQISKYSYQKGGTVYLEEDRDLTIFIKALEKNDITYGYKNSYKDTSPIRSYNYFEKDSSEYNNLLEGLKERSEVFDGK